MNDQIKRPRGRPRPPETIERDKALLAHLKANGPQTRNQLAESLGLDKVKTYLSLDRLRKDGKVRPCTDPAKGGGTLWSAEVKRPCP